MNITENPKAKFSYVYDNPNLDGDGAQIPVFIGYTGNATPVGGLLKFRDYNGAKKTSEFGGIGAESDDNVLLATIENYLEEVRKRDVEDTTVPYVYAIDLGAVPTTTENDVTSRAIKADDWLNAMLLAKTALDAQVEVYCGFTPEDDVATVVGILESAKQLEIINALKGTPRDLYFTLHGATDEQLIDMTDDSKTHYIQASQIGLCQPDDFGKIVGRICTTPAHIEPGYPVFRSISNGIYNKRDSETCEELQNAGIIFINDERPDVTRINLATATSFASSSKPNDCLFHHRRNTNQLSREIYNRLFEQIKANESQTNIAYLQTDINTIVKDKIKEEKFMKGSYCTVSESDLNPYKLKVEGSVKPVNSTITINFTMYVDEPNAIGGA